MTLDAWGRMHDASGRSQDAGCMTQAASSRMHDEPGMSQVAGLKHVQLSSLHLMPHSWSFAQKLQVISLHIDKIGCFKGKNR